MNEASSTAIEASNLASVLRELVDSEATKDADRIRAVQLLAQMEGKLGGLDAVPLADMSREQLEAYVSEGLAALASRK